MTFFRYWPYSNAEIFSLRSEDFVISGQGISPITSVRERMCRQILDMFEGMLQAAE